MEDKDIFDKALGWIRDPQTQRVRWTLLRQGESGAKFWSASEEVCFPPDWFIFE